MSLSLDEGKDRKFVMDGLRQSYLTNPKSNAFCRDPLRINVECSCNGTMTRSHTYSLLPE
jgi:hypothetical protein